MKRWIRNNELININGWLASWRRSSVGLIVSIGRRAEHWSAGRCWGYVCTVWCGTSSGNPDIVQQDCFWFMIDFIVYDIPSVVWPEVWCGLICCERNFSFSKVRHFFVGFYSEKVGRFNSTIAIFSPQFLIASLCGGLLYVPPQWYVWRKKVLALMCRSPVLSLYPPGTHLTRRHYRYGAQIRRLCLLLASGVLHGILPGIRSTNFWPTHIALVPTHFLWGTVLHLLGLQSFVV